MKWGCSESKKPVNEKKKKKHIGNKNEKSVTERNNIYYSASGY